MDQKTINSEIKNQQVSNVNSVATAAQLAQVNAAAKYKKKYKKVRAKRIYKKVYKKVYRSKKKHRYVKAVRKTKTTVRVINSVKVTSTKVTATAKCSCGALGNYNLHTASFLNYCPKCHKSGTLKWNPKGTVEGEWTCSACGADYCAACGKLKIKGSSLHLTKT